MNSVAFDKKQILNFLPYLLITILLSIFINGGILNLLILVSAYFGYKFTPQKIWPIWLISVLALWITIGLSAALSIVPFEEGGETWWSFAIEAFFFMGYLVAIPMWLARWYANRKNE